jgi:FixJ family two-component response regulator
MAKKPTIMVIDDDPSVRKALKRLLRSAEFNVQTFASAQEYLNFSEACEWEIIVLDVRMPGMTGLDLQRKLAAQGKNTPIIFISAHEDEKTQNDALAAGAVAFLHKPFNDEVLLAAIEEASREKPFGKGSQ